MRELPVRKSARLKGYDYSQPGCYFVTMCAYAREEIFGQIIVGAIHESPVDESPAVTLAPAGKTVASVISNIPARYPMVNVNRYIIMPNHIHMIITIREDRAIDDERAIHESPLQQTRSLISKIVGYLKMNATKRIREQSIGIYAVWQRSYHDHIIRSEDEYRRIRQYIDENPAKWREDRYFVP